MEMDLLDILEIKKTWVIKKYVKYSKEQFRKNTKNN